MFGSDGLIVHISKFVCGKPGDLESYTGNVVKFVSVRHEQCSEEKKINLRNKLIQRNRLKNAFVQ